jgi:hypothetical protein
MAKVSLKTIDKAPRSDPPTGSSGAIETRALFDRAADPIHAHAHALAAGATLRIDGKPSDHVVYVWKGAVEAKGAVLDTGSSIVAEHGTAVDVTAGADGATLIEFGTAGRSAEAGAGGHLHLLPSDRVPRIETTAGLNIGSAIFADSHCPTCRVWLHETEFRNPDEPVDVHSHSEDEVIFVTGGSIRLGNAVHGPGAALFVAADTNYGFSTGPDGLTFVNFRPSSPTYTSADGKMVMDEAKFFVENVGKPDYLALAD